MRDGRVWLGGRGGSVIELSTALGFEPNWSETAATGEGPRGARIRIDARSVRATLSAPPTAPFELLGSLAPSLDTTTEIEGTRWRIDANPRMPFPDVAAVKRAVRAWCASIDSVLALDPSLPLSKRDWVKAARLHDVGDARVRFAVGRRLEDRGMVRMVALDADADTSIRLAASRWLGPDRDVARAFLAANDALLVRHGGYLVLRGRLGLPIPDASARLTPNSLDDDDAADLAIHYTNLRDAPRLQALLRFASRIVRIHAATGLAQAAGPEALPALGMLTGPPDVAEAAVRAREAIIARHNLDRTERTGALTARGDDTARIAATVARGFLVRVDE